MIDDHEEMRVTVANLRAINPGVIEEFRQNDGLVGGWFVGDPILLMTHRGARTGVHHTTPLMFSTDGDRFVVVASLGGAPENPQWFRNIVDDPMVTVEVGSERFAAKARVAEGADRDRLYGAHARSLPQFAEYQTKTTRVIPVIVLERA